MTEFLTLYGRNFFQKLLPCSERRKNKKCKTCLLSNNLYNLCICILLAKAKRPALRIITAVVVLFILLFV